MIGNIVKSVFVNLVLEVFFLFKLRDVGMYFLKFKLFCVGV